MEFNENRTRGQYLHSQEHVIVSIPGPCKEEKQFPGILSLIKEPHGAVIEWQLESPPDPKPSTYKDNIEWGDFTVVSYKTKPEALEAGADHEKKPERKKARPINFELADVASLRRCQGAEGSRDSKIVATFFLKDGTGIPSFIFRNHKEYFGFIVALEKHVSIKRSGIDKTLYLINDIETVEMKKSFSGLNLFDDDQPAAFGIQKILKDPYALMNKFSKVANWWLYVNEGSAGNGYMADDVVDILNETHSCIQIDPGEADYEVVTCFTKPRRETIERENPVTPEEWNSYADQDGKFHNVDTLKRRIFKGGIMHSLRSEAWKYLLGFYDFNSTSKEREAKRKLKIDEYYRMKLQWKSISADQESRFSALRERRNIIEKDVSRTDRTHPFFEGDNNASVQMLYDILMTYCMYNFDLGYVQGMSDLLSPILVVMQIEADAFWCFSCWMEVIGVNFEMSQQGMKTQLLNMGRLLHFIDNQLSTYLEQHESGNLYFAFRWLLILFKRDFKFEEAMRLWEVLWTGLPCKNFHLLICLAILDTEKTAIMENNYGLTEILKHVNDMAYKLNLEETLSIAEAIYNQICGCSKVPDVVQTILELELKPEPDDADVAQIEGGESTSNAASPSADTSRNSSSGNRSTCSTDDYVNIEEQCLLSFGLFS